MSTTASRGSVLVTRPAASAGPLCDALAQQRWRVQQLPMLEVEPLPESEAPSLAGIFAALEPASIAIFISVNAVQCSARLLARQGLDWPAGLRCAGIGETTTAAIAAQGWPRLPIQGSAGPLQQDSERLLQQLQGQDVQTDNVLLFCGRGGRDLLERELAGRGAAVSRVETYLRRRPEYSGDSLQQALRTFLAGPDREQRAMLFASGETLTNFCALAGATGYWQQLQALPAVVPSERVAAAPVAAQFENVVVAGNASSQAFLRALASL